jgi:tetratricopeptide (TPR) repeat protein
MASTTTDFRPDHVVFEKLLQAARRDRRTGELAGSAHAAFLEFAQERGWNWAIDLETARLLNSQGNPDDALGLLARCESQAPSEYSGYVHLLRGRILADKEDFEGAIDASRKALAQPGFLNPAGAWVNLGILLRKKGDFDGAIDACHKALAEPGNDQPAYAWNNLGTALARKGDLDGAIEAYRKALARPEYDTPDYAWNNLGNTFFLKGDWEAAINAYGKALAEPKHDSAVKAWVGLGRAYAEMGNAEQARAALENALACPDKGGKVHADARESLDDLAAGSVGCPQTKRPWWRFW